VQRALEEDADGKFVKLFFNEEGRQAEGRGREALEMSLNR
jgi:hypothetical protein